MDKRKLALDCLFALVVAAAMCVGGAGIGRMLHEPAVDVSVTGGAAAIGLHPMEPRVPQ